MKTLSLLLVAAVFITISMNAVMAATYSTNSSVLTSGQLQSLFGSSPSFSYNVTYKSGGQLSAGTSNVINGSILMVERNTTCQSYCSNYLALEEIVANTENPQADYNTFLQSYVETSGPNATSVSGTKSGVTYTLFSFTNSYNVSRNLFVGLYGNEVVLLNLAYTSSALGNPMPSGNLLNSIIQALTINNVSSIPPLSVSISPNTLPYVVMPYGSSKIFTANATGGTSSYTNYSWFVGENLTSINYHKSILSQCSGYSSCNVIANGLIYLYILHNYQENGSDVAYIFANVTDSQGTVAQSSVRIAMPNITSLSIPQPIANLTSVMVNHNVSINDSGASGGTGPYSYELLANLAPNTSYTVARYFGSSPYFSVGPSYVGRYGFEIVARDSSGAEVTSLPVYVNVINLNTTIVQVEACVNYMCGASNTSSCVSPVSGTYSSSSHISLNAKPACDGYSFIGWGANSINATGAYSGPLLNVSITPGPGGGGIAEFANYGNKYIEFAVNVSSVGAGQVVMSIPVSSVYNETCHTSCSYNLTNNGKVMSALLTAQPNPGYKFMYWIESTATGQSTIPSSSLNLEILRTEVFTAVFENTTPISTTTTTISPWSQSYNLTTSIPFAYKGWNIVLDKINANSSATFTLSYEGNYSVSPSDTLTINVNTASTALVGNKEIEIDYTSLMNSSQGERAVVELITYNISIPTTTIPTTTIPTTTITPTPKVILNIKSGWNLLSVPVGSSNNAQNFYLSLENNCGIPNNQKLWGYNGSTNNYVWINGPGSGSVVFENYVSYVYNTNNGSTTTGGGGFWFYSAKQCSINTTDVVFNTSLKTTALDGRNLNVSLSTGWNLVGVPLSTNYTFSTISRACSLRGGFYSYDPSTNSYYNATIPVLGNGYFVYASAPCNLDWTSNSGSSSPPSTP